VNLNNRLGHHQVHVTRGRGNALRRRRTSKCINRSGVTGLRIKKLALHRPDLHLAGVSQYQGANGQDGQSEEENGNREG
jgi:hypothetical protein